LLHALAVQQRWVDPDVEDGGGDNGLRYRYVLDMGQGSALLLLHDWTRSNTLTVRYPVLNKRVGH
jgi:hypothetical protein